MTKQMKPSLSCASTEATSAQSHHSDDDHADRPPQQQQQQQQQPQEEARPGRNEANRQVVVSLIDHSEEDEGDDSPRHPVGTQATLATTTTSNNHWLPFHPFLATFVDPSSWQFVCQQALESNYVPHAPALFRFFDLQYDPHCIVSNVADHAFATDLCCIYTDTPYAILELQYLENDLRMRLGIHDVIKIKPQQVVSLHLQHGIAVLMKVPSYYRLSDTSSNCSLTSGVTTYSQFQHEPQTIGQFAVFCNSERRQRVCQACGIVWFQTMPKCGRCQQVRYCSQLCQRRHWNEHRNECWGGVPHKKKREKNRTKTDASQSKSILRTLKQNDDVETKHNNDTKVLNEADTSVEPVHHEVLQNGRSKSMDEELDLR